MLNVDNTAAFLGREWKCWGDYLNVSLNSG